MAVYRARKKLIEKNILLDLIPPRARLFATAREKVKSHRGVEFTFVDINCRLGLKLANNGSLKLFPKEKELDELFY